MRYSNIDTMELNKYILAKAIENNICKPWADKIAVTNDPDKLMKMYVAGIDFCLEHDFPSNTDLKRLAGGIINQYGIYIDQPVKLSDRGFLVLLGSSTGTVSYSGVAAAELFVNHTSNVAVKASGSDFIMIDCFDNSTVNVSAIGNSKVKINVYGNARVVSEKGGNAMVKIVNKLKATY